MAESLYPMKVQNFAEFSRNNYNGLYCIILDYNFSNFFPKFLHLKKIAAFSAFFTAYSVSKPNHLELFVRGTSLRIVKIG